MEKPAASFGKKWSYFATIAQMLVIVFWFLAAQLIGDAYPVFAINTMRYMIQATICIILLRYYEQSPKLNSKSDIAFMVISAFGYSSMALTKFLAASRLPLGNMDGIFSAVYIVFLVVISTAKRQATLLRYIAGIMAIVGVACIVQPDFLFPNNEPMDKSKSECPCVTMYDSELSCSGKENDDSDNRTYVSMYLNESGDANLRLNDSGLSDTNANATSSEEKDNDSWFTDEVQGYILIILAPIGFGTCTQINSSRLLPKYHFAVMSFWAAVGGSTISLILTLTLESVAFNWFPLCIGILIVAMPFASSAIIFCNIAWVHVPPDQFAILDTLGVVLFFITQYTFMRKYQPPHGNVEEIIGAILVISACLLEPVVSIGKKMRKNKKDDDIEKSTTMSEESEEK